MVFIYSNSGHKNDPKLKFNRLKLSTMKKAFGTGLILVLMTVSPAWAISKADTAAPVPVIAQPLPYIQIPVFKTKTAPVLIPITETAPKRRLPTELSKLVYLGERLTQSGLTIIHESMSYDPRMIYPMVSLYVRMNYRNEPAAEWIAKHAYRNGPTYGVIYVKDAQGKISLLKDFLLHALESI